MSAPLSEQQLAEIAARAGAASPGPWFPVTERSSDDCGDDLIGVGTADDTLIFESPEITPVDAEFIAAARTDVPALLAEVERLQKEAARLQRVADQEHKAFIDTHNALNLLRDDANRVMAENGVQAQQAELERAREQATKFKVQRGEWAAKARTAVARVTELEQQLADVRDARDIEIVRWLGKKAGEYRSTRDKGHALKADAIEVMASKIARGAVRGDA